MDLRSLRAFLVVASELNFRKAAERLHMSQPPLTRLIAALEEELRVKLFERSTVSVGLTPAGRLLEREARGLLDRVEKIEERVRRLGALPAQSIRAGVSNGGFMTDVPFRIARFEKKNRGVKIRIVTGTAERLLKDLKVGRLDFVACETDAHVFSEVEGIEKRFIGKAAVGVLLPLGHPLAMKKKRLKLKDLEGETFVVHPRHEHAHVYEEQQKRLKESGIGYKVYTKKPTENCAILVARGMGISLSTQSHVPPAHTVFRALDEPGFFVHYGVFYRVGERTPEFSALLEEITKKSRG